MASENGPVPVAVEHQHRLQKNPHRFGLYTAMRVIECANPDQPRIGKSVHPGDERFRIGQLPSLNFAASSVTEVDSSADGRIRVWQQVLGLFGPNGPLPIHLTETAWQRLHNHSDPTITAFLNLFHHRLLSLFYRVRADAEPALSFDRPDDDRFQDYIGSLIGLGTPAFRNRDAMPDLVKLHFAGRLGCQARNAESLEVILSTYLDLPVKVEQFIGQWVALPQDCRNSLGILKSTTALGVNTTIGSHVWDCTQKFRIVVGPLTLEQYERLLPGGESFQRMNATVRNYLGHQLQWEVKFVIKRDHIPTMQLGISGNLGWRDWLVADIHQADRADLVLQELEN